MGLKDGNFQKGQSLVEAMVAVGLLAITITGITSYIVNEHKYDTKVSGQNSCRSYVEAVLSDFGDTSKINTINYIPGMIDAATGALGVRNPPLSAPRVEENYYGSINAQWQYGNFQNIDNSVTRAFQAYFGTPAYCTAYQQLTAANIGLLSKDTSGNPSTLVTTINNAGYSVFVQLIPVDIAANQDLTACPLASAGRIRPLAAAVGGNTAANLGPNQYDYGLLLKVRVVDTATQKQQCNGQRLLAYQMDTYQPTVWATDAVAPPSWCDPAGNAGFYNGVISSSKPGSLFLCSWDAPVTYSSPLCQAVAAAPPGGPAQTFVLNNSGPAHTTTDLGLSVTGIPTNYNHTLRILSVDAASNVSQGEQDIPMLCPCPSPTLGCNVNQVSQITSGCFSPPPGPGVYGPYAWVPTGAYRTWASPVNPSPACSTLGCTGNYACNNGSMYCNLNAATNGFTNSNPACTCASPNVIWNDGSYHCTFCAPGTSQACAPGSIANCAAPYANCLADGSAYGACTCAGACNLGYTWNGVSCVLNNPPIDGTCGTANGGSYYTAPSGGSLCNTGAASAVAGSGPWNWTCNGINGSVVNAACSANLAAQVCVPFSVDATCVPGVPVANCSSYSRVCNSSGSGWSSCTCTGCVATYTWDGSTCNSTVLPPINGTCGIADGSTSAVAPSGAALCNSGSATAVAGSGVYPTPWTWSCNGANTGSSSACSAMPIPFCSPLTTQSCTLANCTNATSTCAADGSSWGTCTCTLCNLQYSWDGSNCVGMAGTCGAANGQTLSSAPSGSVLCGVGAPSAVAGSGVYPTPWTWTCTGPGGVSPQCSATPTAVCNPNPPNNTQTCAPPVGCVSALQTCQPDGTAWGTCVCMLCDSSHTLSGGTCVANSTCPSSPPNYSGCMDHGYCSTMTGCSYASCGTSGGSYFDICQSATGGTCGTANNSWLSSAPSGSALCSSGVATPVTGTGTIDSPWTWNCAGTNGLNPVSCKANVIGVWTAASGVSQRTVCNGSCLYNYSTCISAGVSPGGTNFIGFTPCANANNGSQILYYNQNGPAGVCGPSNGQHFPGAPTSGFCTVGTPGSMVGPAGSPSYYWHCGTGGGAPVDCSSYSP